MGDTDNSTESGIYTQPPLILSNIPLTPDLPGINKYLVFPPGSNQFDIQQIVAAIDRLTTAIEKQGKITVLAMLDNAERYDEYKVADERLAAAVRNTEPHKLPSSRVILKSKIRDIDSKYVPCELECPTK